MDEKVKTLKTWSVIFYIIGCFFFCLATYKLTAYANTKYSLTNAYVGGDAYNYIINSSRATGYYVLSIGNIICGAIFTVGKMLMETFGKVKSEGFKENVTSDNSLPPL